MRKGTLCDELDELTRLYDYGIVPGSATIFVKDELNDIVKLDLTLLENVMIVVQVSEEGYKIKSYSPLSGNNIAVSTGKVVQKNLDMPFESMDNLLMTISPMFREKYQKELYSKLESVHRYEQQSIHDDSSSALLNVTTSNGSHSNNINVTVPPSAETTTTMPEPSSNNVAMPTILLQQPLQQQSSLNLDHSLSQDILDDLHNWIH